MVLLLRWPINGKRMVILLRWPIQWRENGHVTAVVNSWRENGHVTEVANLMEGEWSCYRSGHFIGGKMVMLQMWSILWRENGHFTEVLTLICIYVYFIVFYGQSWCFVLVYSISYL